MAAEVRTRRTHEGPVFHVEVMEYEDGDGRPVRRDVVRHPGAVAVVPLLPDGRVLLIRNRRVAVGKRLLEIPAGKLEPGEDPADAVHRELEEETGHRADRIRPLARFYTSPGFTDERMHAFVAEGLTRTEARPEAGEEIDPVPTPAHEAIAMTADGRIEDGKTIAALLLWAREAAQP